MQRNLVDLHDALSVTDRFVYAHKPASAAGTSRQRRQHAAAAMVL